LSPKKQTSSDNLQKTVTAQLAAFVRNQNIDIRLSVWGNIPPASPSQGGAWPPNGFKLILH